MYVTSGCGVAIDLMINFFSSLTMRLINVKTSRLEEFPGSSVPPYAILSHTWGPDSEELNFRDVEMGNINKPGIGSLKFRGCSQLAAKDGLGYAWIDTCCIDKTNLVELSEAINSMFRWYQSAAICYAFLSDVPGDQNPQEEGSTFRKSRWFRRGWTLQEILAPKKLRFYGIVALSGAFSVQAAPDGNEVHDWRLLGTKGNMSTTISSITGIPREYLLGIVQLHDASVAQRMSWAAHRETKRKEDLAYCLLGIFNITMPMIYGEGCDRAFFRLQEQIMKLTRDDSILAWGFDNEPPANKTCTATSGRAMARSPLDFANSGHIIRREQPSQYTRPVNISGGSIRVYLPLITTSNNQMVGLLGCGPENNAQQVVGIPLVELPAGSPDEYIRPQGYSSSLYAIASSEITPKQIQIKHDSQDSASFDSSGLYFHYEEEDFSRMNLQMIEVVPRPCWDKERALIISTTGNDTVSNQILLRLRNDKSESEDFIIVLGYKDQRLDALAECLVFMSSRNTSLEKWSKILPFTMERLNGKARDRKELISLRVKLERFKRQPIFIIRPEKILHEAYATVDATVDRKENSLKQACVQLANEGGVTKREDTEMKDGIYVHDNNLTTGKGERENISVNDKARGQRQRGSAEENGSAEKLLVLKSKELVGEERLRDTSCQNKEVQPLKDPTAILRDQTALRWAAAEGLVKEVERLLDKGADVNAVDKDGWTPLLAASEHEHVEVAEILIKSGADLEAKAEGGMTPLLVASTAGCFNLVRLLLEEGAAIEAEDAEGITPLIAASFVGNVGIVSLLLQHGAHKDTKTKGDLTALKTASMKGHNDVVEILLGKRAPDIEGNNDGDLKSAVFDHEMPASEFALLEAFDPLWREHFGQYINDKELPDDFIKENQEFVVDFLKEKQTTQNTNATPHLAHPYNPWSSLHAVFIILFIFGIMTGIIGVERG